jgi:hypothetical protein
MKIDAFHGSLNLHEFVCLFGSIKSHDVDTIDAVDDFAVGMIQRGGRHVAADGDFDFALGILNQNGAVEGDEDAVSNVF